MAKHAHKPVAKINIPMCIAAILFCLTLFSFHLTGGLYARYITTGTSSDSARVITFGDLTLTETGDFYQPGKILIAPGINLQKKVTVAFEGSEAATYIFVAITPSTWVASSDHLSYSLTVNSKAAMEFDIAAGWTYLKTTGSTHVYVYHEPLAPNTPLSVDLIANDGKMTVNDQLTKSDLAALPNVAINLRAAAVQLNGFATPEAAWDSVSAK